MHVAQFQDVTKMRDDFIIYNLNLSIPKGFITGFIGPNGSGKTTTIEMLMDITQKDSGEIQLFGEDHKNHELKQNIGFVYDDLYMYEDFTIKKMHKFIAPLYENWKEDLFQRYLQEFELPYKKKLKQFSKGMKMKTSLLFALSHEPEFIIMDEPTSGLDPVFRRELLYLLQDLMVRENQTIFLSTHITTDLDQIADYIIFIHEGKLIFQKSMEDIRDNFHLVKGQTNLLDRDTRTMFREILEKKEQFTGLFEGDPKVFEELGERVILERANLEDIMYFLTRK